MHKHNILRKIENHSEGNQFFILNFLLWMKFLEFIILLIFTIFREIVIYLIIKFRFTNNKLRLGGSV